MMILQLPDETGAEPILQPINLAARRRVSGPGLRAFLTVAEHYSIPTRDRVALLGNPSNSTYHKWMKKAQGDMALTLPLDTLIRISGILGIHRGMGSLFSVEAEAIIWLKGPHHGEIFGGQAPLEIIIDGGLDGILTVRRYLDAWRAGLRGGMDAMTEPIRENDVVFT